MFQQAIKEWFDFYFLQTREKYQFDGKDGRHLKSLLKKVENKCKEKGIDPTNENVLNSFRGFLFSLKDPWILENLEIAIVNSKFNSLYAKAKRSSPFTRAVDISEAVRAKYGTGTKGTA